MKKFLAYLLAAIMVLSMVSTAGASELAGTYDITVWVAAEIVDLTKAQIEASGKAPKPEFLQRQIDGRVAKVLKEIVLEDQEFFMSEKNPKKLSVKDYLQEVVAKQLGLSSLKVVNFIRFERGN